MVDEVVSSVQAVEKWSARTVDRCAICCQGDPGLSSVRTDQRGREMSNDTNPYRVATFAVLLLVAVSLGASVLFAIVGVLLG